MGPLDPELGLWSSEDAAVEGTAAPAAHRISAIQLRAAQDFVNAQGLNKLRELEPLSSLDGTPSGWGQFAQGWLEVKDLHLLGVPPAMHPRVLMQCLPPGLRKNVAGWVREDPSMTLDGVFDRLRGEFQDACAYGDSHNWETLTLEAPSGRKKKFQNVFVGTLKGLVAVLAVLQGKFGWKTVKILQVGFWDGFDAFWAL